MTKKIKNRALSLFRFCCPHLPFLVLLFFLSGTISAEPLSDPIDASLNFCGVMEEIIASGRNKFKSIRGKLDLVSEEYFGKSIPPGMAECFGWLDGKVYHCNSDTGLSPDEVGKRYDRFRHSIQQCLSNQWVAKEVRVNRVNARRFITYTSTSEAISLRMSERNKRLGWYLDFYFRR